MRVIVHIIVFCFSTFSFGQLTFYKQFSNNGYDYGEGIVQTEDSSYLITGSSSSFGEGPAQAFVLKIDSAGNFMWSRDFGGSESEGGRRVMYIKDDGILVAGYTNSIGAGAYDFYLLKTDVDGNQLWEKSFGTSSWDQVNDAALTRDSGVIMIGSTLNTIDGEPDILIVRTDKDGNELWSQQMGDLGYDALNSIETLDDSTFVVGGSIFVPDSNLNKGLAFKIEDNGTIWWKDTLGTTGAYEINDIAVESNRIDFVGMQIKPSGDTADFYLKTFHDGLFDYEFNISNPGPEFAVGIAPFGTNKFVLVTQLLNTAINDNVDNAFFQFYPQLYFEGLLGGVNSVGDEFLGQIIPTSDQGAIAVGKVTQSGIGGSSVYVFKLYPDQSIYNSFDYFGNEPLVTIAENEMNNNAFAVYPNPATKMVQVDFLNESFSGVIILYNQLGQTIKTIQATNFSNCTMDVSLCDPGMYRLAFVSANGISSKPLLIK